MNDICRTIPHPDQADLDDGGAEDAHDDEVDGDGTLDVGDMPADAESEPGWHGWRRLGGCRDLGDDGDDVDNDPCPNTPLDVAVDPVIGCSLDQPCPCDGTRSQSAAGWWNHGKDVSRIAKTAASFL